MEIVNYVLIGIILIVILVLVGLFFFSGDEKTASKTKTITKTTHVSDKSISDKYDPNKYINRHGSNRH